MRTTPQPIEVCIIPYSPDKPIYYQNIVPNLATLHSLIGGRIQSIPLFLLEDYNDRPSHAYLNEEGKLKDPPLPRNERATLFLHKVFHAPQIFPNDYIAGNLVILGPASKEGNETSILPEMKSLLEFTFGAIPSKVSLLHKKD